MSPGDFTFKTILAALMMVAPAYCAAQAQTAPAAPDARAEQVLPSSAAPCSTNIHSVFCRQNVADEPQSTNQANFLRHERAEQQGPGQSAQAPEICGLGHLGRCFKDVLSDQAGILTSPLRLHARDAVWLAPFGGATAAALYYDSDALQQLGYNKTRIDISENISRFGTPYAMFGSGAVLYAIGAFGHKNHLLETGRLGMEAVVDASILVGEIKLVTNRERPGQGSRTGRFWPDGFDRYRFNSSFPSGHTASTWAFAHVLAAEYPNWLVRIGAYSFATAISISRVTGRDHFPSDSIVGSVLGYLIGGYVVHHHRGTKAQARLTVLPYVDESSRTFGLAIDIPLTRHVQSSEDPTKLQ